MKINIICFFSIYLCTMPVMAATLELVTMQYHPYQYEENGEIKGIVVDIVTEVFRRLQQPVKITLMPWARSIKMIEDGTADAIFTAYKTPERALFADYSEEVLLPQVVSLFVLKESAIVFDGDLYKLANYRFGVVNKVSYGSIFDNAIKNKLLKKTEVTPTFEQNIEKLLAGRFDVLVNNRNTTLDFLKRKGLMNKVKELAPAVQANPSFIAFSKKRNLSLMRDRFDEVLLAMKKDGSYERIMASQNKVK